MRHMKKVTAIVLVLVMTFALTLSAGAYNYKDDAKIAAKYRAAIDSLYELNVMRGSTTDNFNPGVALTRGQMAIVMYNVVKGGNTGDNASLYAAASVGNLTDVEGHGYANYIKWSILDGKTEGTSATTWSPDRELMGIEALGFVLGICGYNMSVEGRAGGLDWRNNFLRLVGDNPGLLIGMEDVTADLNKIITRDATAQLIYNAIFNCQFKKYNAAGVAEDSGKTVGEQYFGFMKFTGTLIGIGPIGLGGAGPGTGKIEFGTDANAISTILTQTAGASLDMLGRKVILYVKGEVNASDEIETVSKVYGNAILANTDSTLTCTVGDLTLNVDEFEYKPGDTLYSTNNGAPIAATDDLLYSNYTAVDEPTFSALNGDNPVTLIIGGTSGTEILKVFAMDYEVIEITDVDTDGKVKAVKYGTTTTYGLFDGSKKVSEIVLDGAGLATKGNVVLAAEIVSGAWYKLLAVEKFSGNPTDTTVAKDRARISGTWYDVCNITGSMLNTDKVNTALSSQDFYRYNGKLIDAIPGPGDPDGEYVIFCYKTIISAVPGSEVDRYFMYSLSTGAILEYEIQKAGTTGAPLTAEPAAGSMLELTSVQSGVIMGAKTFLGKDVAGTLDPSSGIIAGNITAVDDTLKLVTLLKVGTGQFYYNASTKLVELKCSDATFKAWDPAPVVVTGVVAIIDGGTITTLINVN